MAQNQDDEWVTAAMADDSAVADLLTRFRRGTPPQRSALSPPPLGWTVRQPRSKPAPRASPTTPLSWSGATSASGGSEELSRPQPPSEIPVAARSKVTAAVGVSIDKRSRKKKTFTELKEEETLLVNERKDLTTQLETLRVTLENQRAVNQNLKRYKIDLQSQRTGENDFSGSSTKAITNQIAHTGSSISPEDFRNEKCEAPKTLFPTHENSSEIFVLPDLNLPFGEHTPRSRCFRADKDRLDTCTGNS